MKNNFNAAEVEELTNEQLADINGGGFWHDLGFAIGDFLYDLFHPKPADNSSTTN